MGRPDTYTSQKVKNANSIFFFDVKRKQTLFNNLQLFFFLFKTETTSLSKIHIRGNRYNYSSEIKLNFV